MASTWEHADIFPAIARIISGIFEKKQDFVTHDEIVESILADSEASLLVANALSLSTNLQTADWIAHNMVAWFSQRITAGDSNWIDQFERKKIDFKWAYRPKSELNA
jgi:Zn-dependent M28 family amino/carboxypeptidase